MKIIRSLTDFLKWRKQITHKEIGLVHTMGNLHDGHISLIKKAQEKNDIIILTILHSFLGIEILSIKRSDSPVIIPFNTNDSYTSISLCKISAFRCVLI